VEEVEEAEEVVNLGLRRVEIFLFFFVFGCFALGAWGGYEMMALHGWRRYPSAYRLYY